MSNSGSKKRVLSTKYTIFFPRTREKEKIPIILIPPEIDMRLDEVSMIFHHPGEGILFIVYEDEDFNVLKLTSRVNERLRKAKYEKMALFNCKREEIERTEGKLLLFREIVEE